ncbi:hypothetical protein HNP86_002018 [Methanococcus maripaludis]|uniref:Uncharacterized protein n=1 Tax=Methanococcus maripaludis TaxID=39152 RepID=A0A7J9NVZ9_METMI|nr:hypothetical protein [Methanococcus maripaludis]MBA2851859.1 hypothetical protein [Methanococcus maripaludis]
MKNMETLSDIFNSNDAANIVKALLFKRRKGVNLSLYGILLYGKSLFEIITMSSTLKPNKYNDTEINRPKIIIYELEVLSFMRKHECVTVKEAIQYIAFAKFYYVLRKHLMNGKEFQKYSDECMDDTVFRTFLAQIEPELVERVMVDNTVEYYTDITVEDICRTLSFRHGCVDFKVNIALLDKVKVVLDDIHDINTLVSFGCYYINRFGPTFAASKNAIECTKYILNRLSGENILDFCTFILSQHMRCTKVAYVDTFMKTYKGA